MIEFFCRKIFLSFKHLSKHLKISYQDNSTGNESFICSVQYDFVALQWMDLFNSTIVPFMLMIVLSIALIHTVRASRARVHTTTGLGSQSKRDKRFAISAISLNLIFFILNMPIVIYDMVALESGSQFFDYLTNCLFYLYYASSFYVQLTVNSEFKREFLKLLNLRQMGNNEAELGTTKANYQIDSVI